MKEKVFWRTLGHAIVDAGEMLVVAILTTLLAIVIFTVVFAPCVLFAMKGWWVAAVLWGVLDAIVFIVWSQSGGQLARAWEEDHKK